MQKQQCPLNWGKMIKILRFRGGPLWHDTQVSEEGHCGAGLVFLSPQEGARGWDLTSGEDFQPAGAVVSGEEVIKWFCKNQGNYKLDSAAATGAAFPPGWRSVVGPLLAGAGSQRGARSPQHVHRPLLPCPACPPVGKGVIMNPLAKQKRDLQSPSPSQA